MTLALSTSILLHGIKSRHYASGRTMSIEMDLGGSSDPDSTDDGEGFLRFSILIEWQT